MDEHDDSGHEFNGESRTEPYAELTATESALLNLSGSVHDIGRGIEQAARSLRGHDPAERRRRFFELCRLIRASADEMHDAARIMEDMWRQA